MESSQSSPPLSDPRSSQSDESVPPESRGQRTHIRFLIANSEAGSVIGRGGTNISDFQSQSGGRIQLSRNYEFFPGTTDRIIKISGSISSVLNAVELILIKLLNELHSKEGDACRRTRLRIIVPHSCCGGIIGKGGAIIKSFVDESHAGIQVSPSSDVKYAFNERLVTLTGTIEEQMVATDLILTKLTDHPLYSQAQAPFAPAAVSCQNMICNRPNGAGGTVLNNQEQANDSLTFGVADEHIGLVVGRGGKNLLKISQVSGAKIKISDRGDFISGTTDRKVTIMGSHSAIRAAERMILHKVSVACVRAADPSNSPVIPQ